ncbi:MAG TPA: lysylphosphatidylglycerol synthase transmembrane domain-containing protein [bacterium]|nr:lysylphosphatidylglycerol synthase transmembrane domain-containing protein [bacterium]
MRRLSSFSFLLGLLLFILLLSMVDLPTVGRLLAQADWKWMALALLFILPEVLIKALRLKALARTFGSHLPFSKANWIYLAGQPLGAVTPAKLGDIVRVLGIGRWGNLKPHSAFAVHVADKVYDLLALVLLAATGLITLIAQSQFKGPAVAALMGIGMGVLLMALFLNPQWMRVILKPLLLFLAPRKLADQLRAHGTEFYRNLLSLFLPSQRLTVPFALSMAAWLVVLVRTYFCAMALGLPMPFITIALLLPIVIVIEFIPITILGFGTREAALFFFFTTPLVTHAGLISFSLMTVLAGPLLTSLIGIPCAIRMGQSTGAPK